MPAYQTTPFKPSPTLLVSGTPEYVFGSYNDKSSPTFGYIQTDSAVTTTATVTFQIVSGNIPAVGDLVTVRGAARSNNFNVTNVAIASVSTTDAGVCTITYTISSTSLGTAADGGQVMIPVTERGESLSSGTTASVPVAVPFNNPQINQGRTLTATVNFITSPQQGTFFLQGSVFDIDAQYEDIAVITGAGSVSQLGNNVEVADLAYRFYRIRAVGIVGTCSVVAKITC